MARSLVTRTPHGLSHLLHDVPRPPSHGRGQHRLRARDQLHRMCRDDGARRRGALWILASQSDPAQQPDQVLAGHLESKRGETRRSAFGDLGDPEVRPQKSSKGTVRRGFLACGAVCCAVLHQHWTITLTLYHNSTNTSYL